MKKNKFYITTAIPYVNADPHVGFAMELVETDVLARYHRQIGDDVRFLTGSDENALKNVRKAEQAGTPIKEFIDDKVQELLKLVQKLNLSNDDFIRTTEERHIRSSQKLWQACVAAGDIYKKKYTGLYCIGCEEFKTPKELIDDKCPEHRRYELEKVEEENYFFKLSNYQEKLGQLLDSGELEILPEKRKNEIREFVRQGLSDFSISRSATRAKGWGIPVPGDDSQVIYVWFDALVNYISALGYDSESELFKKYWQENDQRCHVVGKGITRFHAIYWPAMLLSAGLKPPSKIYVHGYATINGEKISKSVGDNSTNPFTFIEKYGADVLRYFLLREIPSTDDGDFSEEKLVARYNGDLANGLGNLVARVATLLDNNFSEGLEYNKNLIDPATISAIDKMQNSYRTSMENFKLHEALIAIWELISCADKYANDTKPWVLIKEDVEKFKIVMINLVEIIYQTTKALEPFMSETADKISIIFDFKKEEAGLEGRRLKVQKGTVLFPRL